MNKENGLKITSIEEIKKFNDGNVVRLPDFSEDQPFVARLKRVSMLKLAGEGKIPNPLMEVANNMFLDGATKLDREDNEMLKSVFELCDIFAKASLVEPSYEEITKAGYTLTDNQYLAIFNYCQNGVDAIKPFL